MAVEAFDFTKDKFDETKEVYYEILNQLGVKDPAKYIEEHVSAIPPAERNGLMFGNMVEKMFKDEDERRAKASEIVEKILVDDKISPYVKAYFGEMTGEYIPYDTVLTAGIMVGKGKSLQMGCGEGKTGVLSMASFAKISQSRKQVFLTSSTPILAAEALDKLPFYSEMGIADHIVLVSEDGVSYPVLDENGKITYETIVDDYGEEKVVPAVHKETFEGKSDAEVAQLLDKAYNMPIVTSDNATLMKHSIDGYLPRETKFVDRELLADEADFVLLDSYRPVQKTIPKKIAESREDIALRVTAYDLLKEVREKYGEGLYDFDDANQYVDFSQKGRAAVVKEINRKFSRKDVDRSTLYDFMYDALKVETIYRENRDYQILDGGKEIVSEDRASGVSIDLPQGVRQALEVKLTKEKRYTGPLTPEAGVVDTTNVQQFFQNYFQTKHFISGTLGLDSEEIVNELMSYGVEYEAEDIYEIPPKGEGKRIDHGKTMFASQDEKREAIVKNALENIKEGRPVLIGAVSEEELLEIQKKLQKSGYEGTTLLYTAASEKVFARDKEEMRDDAFKEKYGVGKGTYVKYSDLIKKESGKKDVITLGTSIIGRGTTIKTSKDINKAGGIHVIIDGLHETSSRNQEQYKARTARGSDAGSTIEYFAIDDIPEQYRDGILPGDNADDVYKNVYQKIDSRTASVRRNVVFFVEKTTDVLKYVASNPNLSNEQRTKATLLTMARAFSIRNRALGVSDSFEQNIAEYEREIEMYTYMYMSKVQNKDFDEVKWMQDNGYQDKIATHLPFTQKEEEKLFGLYGIKSQVLGGRTGGVKLNAETLKKTLEQVKDFAPDTKKVEDEGVSL